MAHYRLYFFSPRSHGIMKFEKIEADSDEAALDMAANHRGDMPLELWCDKRKVGSIEATDLASRLLALRAARGEQSDPLSA